MMPVLFAAKHVLYTRGMNHQAFREVLESHISVDTPFMKVRGIDRDHSFMVTEGESEPRDNTLIAVAVQWARQLSQQHGFQVRHLVNPFNGASTLQMLRTVGANFSEKSDTPAYRLTTEDLADLEQTLSKAAKAFDTLA